MVAELLGIAQANVVVKLTLEQGRFIAERQVESGLEVVEGNLPAVITTQKGLNDPRYPNLKGIMAAKKKEIMALPLTESLSPSLQTLKLTLPPPRAEGRQLSGTPQEQAQALFAALQNEAKIF